jgi:hypothetical protein
MILFFINQLNKTDLNVKNKNAISVIDALMLLIQNQQIKYKPSIENTIKGIVVTKESNTIGINSKIARTPIIQNSVGLLIKILETESFSRLYTDFSKMFVQLLAVFVIASSWILLPNYIPEILGVIVISIQWSDYSRRKKISNKILELIDQNNLIADEQRYLVEGYLKYWNVKLFSLI